MQTLLPGCPTDATGGAGRSKPQSKGAPLLLSVMMKRPTAGLEAHSHFRFFIDRILKADKIFP